MADRPCVLANADCFVGRLSWTKSRQRALIAFCDHGGFARQSNRTDDVAGTVYWQAVDWMVSELLIEPVFELGPDWYRLSLRGFHAARDLEYV